MFCQRTTTGDLTEYLDQAEEEEARESKGVAGMIWEEHHIFLQGNVSVNLGSQIKKLGHWCGQTLDWYRSDATHVSRCMGGDKLPGSWVP